MSDSMLGALDYAGNSIVCNVSRLASLAADLGIREEPRYWNSNGLADCRSDRLESSGHNDIME